MKSLILNLNNEKLDTRFLYNEKAVQSDALLLTEFCHVHCSIWVLTSTLMRKTIMRAKILCL